MKETIAKVLAVALIITMLIIAGKGPLEGTYTGDLEKGIKKELLEKVQ